MLSYDNSHPKVHFPYCCYGFVKCRNGIENLRKHKLHCEEYGPQRTEMPKETFIHFKELTKMQKLPFTIYADFETLNVKLQGFEPGSKSYTEKKTQHVCRHEKTRDFATKSRGNYFPNCGKLIPKLLKD